MTNYVMVMLTDEWISMIYQPEMWACMVGWSR